MRFDIDLSPYPELLVNNGINARMVDRATGAELSAVARIVDKERFLLYPNELRQTSNLWKEERRKIQRASPCRYEFSCPAFTNMVDPIAHVDGGKGRTPFPQQQQTTNQGLAAALRVKPSLIIHRFNLI